MTESKQTFVEIDDGLLETGDVLTRTFIHILEMVV